MPAQQRTCRKCSKDFTLLPNKPGNINDCAECAGEDVPLLMAKVSWENKHTPIIEVTADREAAIAFNKAQVRGFGPLSTFGGHGEGLEGRESAKDGTGAEIGALYHSPLGRSIRLSESLASLISMSASS